MLFPVGVTIQRYINLHYAPFRGGKQQHGINWDGCNDNAANGRMR